MKVKALIKKLSKFDPNLEVMIKEIACDNVRSLEDVFSGWYHEDSENAPDVIEESENPEDYGVDKNKPKVVCLN